MRIRILNTASDIEDIQKIWMQLLDTCEASYFSSWSWIQNWIETAPDKSRVKLFYVEESGIPVMAFFAGVCTNWRYGIIRCKGVYFNSYGNSTCDRLCTEYNTILRASNPKSVVRDLIESMPVEWDEFRFPNMDRNTFTVNEIRTLRDRWNLTIEETPTYYVNLKALTGDYLESLSRNTRNRIRHAIKIYDRKGGVKIEVAASIDDALRIFRELAELNNKRFKQRGAFRSEYFRLFHENLILKSFLKGEIQLLRFSDGRKLIGCLYAFLWRGKVYQYQSGFTYEEGFKEKPGLVCHYYAIQLCRKLGFEKYDFLGGDSQYKRSMSTDQDMLITATVQKHLLKFAVENCILSPIRKGLHGLNKIIFAGKRKG